MRKIIYTLLLVTTISLVLPSCSSEPQPVILTPKSTQLRGDLKEYFEVVDKEYTLTDGWGKIITVELKKIKEMPFDKSTTDTYGTSGYDVERHIGFGIKLFDDFGNIIEQRSPTASGMQGPYSNEEILNFKNIEVGETSIIRWSLDTDDEETLKTLYSFEITSATEDVSGTSSNWGSQKESKSSSSVSKSSSSNEDSEQWDAILDDYEKYVNDYVKLLKKANAGDMSALSDSVSMLETAESLCEKLEDAEDELSTSQMSRYMKITTKIMEAY